MLAGALYHVTARRNNRERFLDRLADVVRTQRLQVHAFVLMRNHDPLLVQRPKANLAGVMGHPDSAYARDFSRCYRW